MLERIDEVWPLKKTRERLCSKGSFGAAVKLKECSRC